ncbi:dnaJ homolog subfamily C member 10-like [Branchiostoma floridae]|uniref:protein disulfide-isomerase n=1 Tax=Branchiostoma floridae TaxID=7739 RepID=A0A9J7HFB3_BRAFL|nr:dnaJ homolog subfamily C member 10-like [Branchiostoma floridae]
MAAPRCFAVFVCVLMLVPFSLPAKKNKMAHILTVEDHKEFKKILRTRTNVLSLFAKSERAASPILDTFAQVAEDMKGLGTLVFVDCSDKEAKKLCKKVKSNPDTYELKHYKDGDFNKGYDRQETYKSMMNFLRDPTGDIPWEEDPTAKDVVHVESDKALNKLVKKEKTPILMMFYAPWCGHCKRLKPDYAAAATELKGQATLAGMDVDKPENEPVRRQFNITGFPTILYFEGGKQKYKYGGENNKQGIVSWMKDPQPPVEKAPEPEWSDVESDVVHLTDETFDTYMEEHASVLVMFYAPWCGHCKKMKPEYDEAATTLKEESIDGVLAAVDATKSPQVAKRFEVKGYPTVKYFKDGEEAFGFNDRTADKIVDFMKDPKEPPPPPPPEQPWQDVESEVVHLGDEDFKSQLKRRKHALVMFYAPWCGHCKKAKPHFTNAAEKYKEDTKVTFAAVDCTTHQGVCGQYEVRGYPTIKYFNYGKNPKDYEGGREEADFVAFMSDPLNPTPPTPPPKDPAEEWAELEGAEEVVHLHDNTFEDFIQQNPSVLVMFYAPWCGHCKAMKPDYALAAKALKEDEVPGVLAAVDATVDRVLQSKYDITGFPTLKHFKDGEFNTDYNKGRNLDALVEFMKNPQKAPPPPPPEPEWSEVPSEISHLTDDTFNGFIQEHSSVLVMFYAPWCGHCKKMKPAYQDAAEKLLKENPEAKLAAVDATKYAALGTKYEVRGYPTIKYFKNGEMAFQYNKGRTTDDIVAFMKDPKDTPPPAPEKEWSEEASDVVHLTDATFATYTQENSPVLVMFYAPWCGHCKRAKPEYTKAAEQLKKDAISATLAAVDCTKHSESCKAHDVKGYPTFKLIKDGVASDYNLGRTSEDFMAFMLNSLPKPPKDEPKVEEQKKEEPAQEKKEEAKPKEEKKEEPKKEAEKPAAEEKERPKRETPTDEWASTDTAADVNFLTTETFDQFVADHKSVLVMFYAPWCGHCKRMKPAFEEAATRLKTEFPAAKLAALDATQFRDVSTKYEVRGYPTLLYFKDGQKEMKYQLGRSTDDLVKFMKNPQAPPPPPPPESEWSEVPSEINHLTDQTFDSFVYRHSSVLVMFYAPWCGHCKRMKPAYQEAAEQLKKEKPEAKLAAVDATKYKELGQQYGVRGYPTLKYFKNGKVASDYNKGRGKDDIVAFMKAPQVAPLRQKSPLPRR